MRKRKKIVKVPDTWEDVKHRVTKEMEKSMFNFKEGVKINMLKVQYFKHPDIAFHLYDSHFATFGRLPWNVEVSLMLKNYFMQNYF